MPPRHNETQEMHKHLAECVTFEGEDELAVGTASLTWLGTVPVRVFMMALSCLYVLPYPGDWVQVVILFDSEQMRVHPEVARLAHSGQVADRQAHLQQLVKVGQRQVDRQ